MSQADSAHDALPVGPQSGEAAPTVADPWAALRRFTAARIALGRAGVSLPTARHLEFTLAHARARDAVHAPLDAVRLAAALHALGVQTVSLHSAAADRTVYLQRPDLGRRLDDASRERLRAMRAAPSNAQSQLASQLQSQQVDVAFVAVDGLSARAVEQHVVALLERVLPQLSSRQRTVAPVGIVEQGRVAIGDEVGEVLGARIVVVMIGERPGLSSPDSLGLYLTWAPRPGLTDAARNCISNVRPQGLAYDAAAQRLLWLLDAAFERRLSGVGLKDETASDGGAIGKSSNFLLDAGD